MTMDEEEFVIRYATTDDGYSFESTPYKREGAMPAVYRRKKGGVEEFWLADFASDMHAALFVRSMLFAQTLRRIGKDSVL